MTRTDGRWIELEGAENVRDLGGLPTAGGDSVRPHRLLRSDSLQVLTETDVRFLVDEVGVTAVADLRTGVEVAGEGPGPMHAEPGVEVRHLSLLPEPDGGVHLDDSGDGPIVLPWHERDRAEDAAGRGVSGVYLGYLDDRPDAVVEAVRLIAHTGGATVVHCAAGKDRTGTIVALALAEVGVPSDEIVADYVLSAERVEAVIARLVTRRTYRDDLVHDDSQEGIDKHKPRPETMQRLLAALEAEHGGAAGWLRAHGWTDADADALRAKLLDS